MNKYEEDFNDLIQFMGNLPINEEQLLKLTELILYCGNSLENKVKLSTLEEVEKMINEKRYTDRKLNDSVHWFEIKRIIKELKQRGNKQ